MATHGPRSSTGNDSSSNVLRGALLIGVAVILGAVLLAQSFKDGGSPVSAAGGVGGTAGTTTSTVKRTETSTTPTTAPQPHDPASVKVLVLNGSGKSGIAKAGADQLKAANYTTLDPRNASSNTPVPTSAVYFTAGYQADAQQIATKLGLAPAAVQALPSPPPPTVGDPKDANVVVLIGADAPVAAGGSTTTTTAAN